MRVGCIDEEIEFWDHIGLLEHFEPGDFELEKIKVKANKHNIPYQSYIKMKLSEALGFQQQRPL